MQLFLRLSLLACAIFCLNANAEGKWKSLFNGKNLDGWTVKIKGQPLGKNFKDTFRVEDGLMKVGYAGYDEFNQQFGHIFYKKSYSHYRIRVEHRFVGKQIKGGPGWAWRNSGIMLHCQDPKSMALEQDFPVSIEVQLLGGPGKAKRTTGNLCTPGTNVVMGGKLVRRHCINSKSKTYHGDQWVTCELEVRGNNFVRHKINGEVVLEYTNPQLDDRDGDAKPLIASRGGDKMLKTGTISLQSESHPCEFRNIMLQPLKGN